MNKITSITYIIIHNYNLKYESSPKTFPTFGEHNNTKQ